MLNERSLNCPYFSLFAELTCAFRWSCTVACSGSLLCPWRNPGTASLREPIEQQSACR